MLIYSSILHVAEENTGSLADRVWNRIVNRAACAILVVIVLQSHSRAPLITMDLHSTWMLPKASLFERVGVIVEKPLVIATNYDVCVAHGIVDLLGNGSWHQVPILVSCTFSRSLKHTPTFLMRRTDTQTQLAHLSMAWSEDVACAPLCLIQHHILSVVARHHGCH